MHYLLLFSLSLSPAINVQGKKELKVLIKHLGNCAFCFYFLFVFVCFLLDPQLLTPHPPANKIILSPQENLLLKWAVGGLMFYSSYHSDIPLLCF